MTLLLTEEQQMLKNSAREFFADRSPVRVLRRLRDERDPLGYDAPVWKDMAEMGWTGLIIPEEYGGLNFGYIGLGLVMEESGRVLAASPFFSTAVLGAMLLLKGGNPQQKAFFLPAIARGELITALALEESPYHQPSYTALQAIKHGEHFQLNGKKTFVLDGHVADWLIVAARTSGAATEKNGISLFLVPSSQKGLHITRNIMVDSRNAATVELEQVEIPASSLLGQEGEGYTLLEPVLDTARIVLSAEMLGMMQEAFERTIAYLKERRQFGVPIGSFQALQHRVAKLYGEIELCKSLVIKSLHALNENASEIPLLASAVKAKACQVIQQVTTEAIQMFGGIGMTDDEEIGFFLKRAKVVQQTFGGHGFHLDRFAALLGY